MATIVPTADLQHVVDDDSEVRRGLPSAHLSAALLHSWREQRRQ